MMFTQKCEKCGETISLENQEYVRDSRPVDRGARHWHFECADFGTPMATESRTRWNTWKLKQMDESNRKELNALRGRTEALRNMVMDLMRRAGCSEEEIENFKCEYGFREERD